MAWQGYPPKFVRTGNHRATVNWTSGSRLSRPSCPSAIKGLMPSSEKVGFSSLRVISRALRTEVDHLSGMADIHELKQLRPLGITSSGINALV